MLRESECFLTCGSVYAIAHKNESPQCFWLRALRNLWIFSRFRDVWSNPVWDVGLTNTEVSLQHLTRNKKPQAQD